MKLHKVFETTFSVTDKTDHKAVMRERRETRERISMCFLAFCLEALSNEQHMDVKPKQIGGLTGKGK